MQYSSGMCIIVKESELFNILEDIDWEKFYLNENFGDYIERKVKSGEECISVYGDWGCPEDKLKDLLEMIRDEIPESILLGFSTSISSDPYCIAMYSMPNDDIWAIMRQETKFGGFYDNMGLPEVLKWLNNMKLDLSEDEISNIYSFFGVEKDGSNSKQMIGNGDTFEDILRYHFKLKNEKLSKVIDSDITLVTRFLIVCDDEEVFEELQEFFVEYGEDVINNNIVFEKDSLSMWGIIENLDCYFSWFVEDYRLIEDFAGRIILVSDLFEVDWDDDGYQEGVAIAYFGNEEKREYWYYDEEPRDNCDLNISDFYQFIKTYNMFLDEKEKTYMEKMYLNSCNRKVSRKS